MGIYVFAHGMPSNGSTWESFFEHAPAGARCLAWDAPDSGHSADAPNATLAEYETALVDFVRSQGEPVVLVGHSFGAWLAARVLPKLGTAVERVVFVAGLPALTREHAEGFIPLAEGVESGAIGIDQVVAIASDLWLPAVGRNPIHAAWIDRMVRHEGKARVGRDLRRMIDLAKPEWAVQAFDTPARLVQARDDRAVPLAYGTALAALGSNVETTVLEGDSHFLQWTAPEDVARVVFG